MKLSLMVTEGVHAGQVIPVGGVSLLIGRGPQCHLRPNSPAVAERHCNLTIRGERAFVRDLDSRGGTFLNDRQLRGEIELRDGDFLRIGPLVLVIQLEVGAETAGAETLSALDAPLPEAPHVAAETQEMPAFVPEPLTEELLPEEPELAAVAPDWGAVERRSTPRGAENLDWFAPPAAALHLKGTDRRGQVVVPASTDALPGACRAQRPRAFPLRRASRARSVGCRYLARRVGRSRPWPARPSATRYLHRLRSRTSISTCWTRRTKRRKRPLNRSWPRRQTKKNLRKKSPSSRRRSKDPPSPTTETSTAAEAAARLNLPKSGHMEVACPTCSTAGLVPWDRLDGMLCCSGCWTWFRIGGNGQIVVVDPPAASQGALRLFARNGPDRTVMLKPGLLEEKRQTARRQRRWGRAGALVSGLPIKTLLLLLFLGGLTYGGARWWPKPRVVKLPVALDQRARLLAESWLKHDTPVMVRMAHPNCRGITRRWAFDHQPPLTPGQFNRRKAAIDVRILRQDADTAEIEVRVDCRG